MIGLDTNVIVRYIMQDDPKQSPKATQLIESLSNEAPGYITMVSVVELYWVLTSCYGLSDTQVTQALEAILRSKQLLVERADQVMRALRVFAVGKADFADFLIERFAKTLPVRRNAFQRAQPVADAEDVDADLEFFRLERERRQRHIAAVATTHDADAVRVDVVERLQVLLRIDAIPKRFATMFAIVGRKKRLAVARRTSYVWKDN